jgi:DNA-binding protein HU-beta
MNKAELIQRTAAVTDLSQKDVARALDGLIEVIQSTVANGEKVTLVGFGAFEAKLTKERMGRNPATGEELVIPAKLVPRFHPGKEFKTQVGGS